MNDKLVSRTGNITGNEREQNGKRSTVAEKIRGT